jgi:hypothetical protein
VVTQSADGSGADPGNGGLLTRRGFLRGGLGVSLAALAQLRCLPALEGDPGRFFSASETEILTQIVERMVYTGEPGAPAVRETRAIPALDALAAQLDPAISGQLPLALQLFEWGPLLFDFTPTRFTRMSDAAKDASLEAWMTSRLGVRRLGFSALRNLAFLGYYSQDETWRLIGYAGPLVGGLRAAGAA